MRYFIAVVEEHNFTRAADNCHISQSAISQQIKELENTVGTPLLDRKGRSFELTPAGQFFYQRAQQLVADLDQLVTNTRQLAKKERDEYVLHLGYLMNFGTQEFLQAVAQFSQKYPQVKVNIKSGMHEDLFKLLRDDKIDLDFADQRRALSDEYCNEFLTETDFMAVLPKGRFAGQDRVSTDDLADLPCIIVAGQAQEAQEQEYCRDVLGVRSQFMDAATLDEAQMMVTTGQGFTIVNGRTKGQLDTSVVDVLPLYNGQQPLHQKYYAYWKQDNSGYYIEGFAQLLKEQFK